MKQKIISMFFIAMICSVICSFAIVSAAANFTITTSTPAVLTKTNSSTSFLITPNGQPGQSVNIAVNIPTKITDSKGNEITINPPYILNYPNVLFGSTTTPIAISYSGIVPSSFDIGKFSSNINITVVDTLNPNNTLTQTLPIYFTNDFCTNGEQGSSEFYISDVSIDNSDGDDDEWSPLDEITIKVEVSNDMDDRVRDVTVELGLFDETGKNIAKNLDNLNDRKIDLGTISDSDEKIAEFKFTVPSDFNEDNYKLVIKAYSDDAGEDTLCSSRSTDLSNDYYQSINGVRETEEENQIVLTDLVLSPSTAQCSDVVQLSAEVVNIGDEDYLDQVKVTLYNKELGINTEEILREDFDAGDSSTVNFEFSIPENAAEKTYNLELVTYYDYDEDDDTYDITSDKKFYQLLKVEGNCVEPVPPTTTPPLITAELDTETPEAIAGKQVIIKTTVKNQGTTEDTYTLSVVENSAWSTLDSIQPRVLTIPAGSTKEASIVLTIDPEAEGNKEFNIRTTYGVNSDKTAQQAVGLTITKETTSSDFGPVVQNLKDNWFIYLIILVNVVLILAIILVIRRMMRPRASAM
jgi:hypothetical protein